MARNIFSQRTGMISTLASDCICFAIMAKVQAVRNHMVIVNKTSRRGRHPTKCKSSGAKAANIIADGFDKIASKNKMVNPTPWVAVGPFARFDSLRKVFIAKFKYKSPQKAANKSRNDETHATDSTWTGWRANTKVPMIAAEARKPSCISSQYTNREFRTWKRILVLWKTTGEGRDGEPECRPASHFEKVNSTPQKV